VGRSLVESYRTREMKAVVLEFNSRNERLWNGRFWRKAAVNERALRSFFYVAEQEFGVNHRQQFQSERNRFEVC
jgi:hypothetical protein